MNSILYQLYMIPPFRKGILSLQEEHFSNTNKIDNLPYQLKKLFEEYDIQSGKLPDIKSFCYAFKDFEGKPTNPSEAFDAVEFLNILLDKLGTSLETIGQSDILNKPLMGKLIHEIIPKSCSHKKSREEDHYLISLDIKNKKNVEESFENFIQGEMLEGENKYNCSECQSKVDVLKRTCLLETPNYLILDLKRFEFNYDTFQKEPIFDYYELPMILDLKPFTQEGLLKAGNASEEEKSSQGNERYRLSGAVIYQGTGEVGKYYSLIKDRESDEQWYKVSEKGPEKFDVKNFPAEAFGGDECTEKTELFKSKKGCAYVVFYDKISDNEEHVYEREP